MDYTKIYGQLIEKYRSYTKSKGTELHHILPRSLGGLDVKENTVHLTLRAHYVAHLLLVKMMQTKRDQYKMMHALKMMSKTRQNIECNSRLYESFKSKYYDVKTFYIVNPETQEQRRIFEFDEIPYGWIKGGAKKTEEHKTRIGKGNTGKRKPEMALENTGKHFYTNPDDETESRLCKEGEEPLNWIRGIKKLEGERGKLYTNIDTQQVILVRFGEEVSEGFVKGNLSERAKENGRISVKSMQTKEASTKAKTTKKGLRPWFNHETNVEKWFYDHETPPKGFVKGKNPANVRSGHNQTNKQKSIAKTLFQKSYEITWKTGEKEIITGLKDFIKRIGYTQMKFDYRKTNNRLHEYGILSMTEILKK